MSADYIDIDDYHAQVSDEALDRVRAALVEAGYLNIEVVRSPYALVTMPVPPALVPCVPHAAAWVALELAGVVMPCWSCYQDSVGSNYSGDQEALAVIDCRRGRCHHPDANRWPPRELLQRAEAAR